MPHPPLVLDEEFDDLAANRLLDALRSRAKTQHGTSASTNADDLKKLELYLSASCRSFDQPPRVRVSYVLKRGGLGRRIPIVKETAPGEGLPCLCTLPKRLRSWLAAPFYHDVDMENAQPALLLQLCERQGLQAPRLKHYIECREEILHGIQACHVDRDDAKELILRLIFHGSVDAWERDMAAKHTGVFHADKVPAFVLRFQAELDRNMGALVELCPAAKKQQQKAKPDCPNPLGTAFAYLIQDLERRCMEVAVEAAREDGYTVGALIYDGMLVKRRGAALPQEALDRWGSKVQRVTGFQVKFLEKQWNFDHSMMTPLGNADDASDECDKCNEHDSIYDAEEDNGMELVESNAPPKRSCIAECMTLRGILSSPSDPRWHEIPVCDRVQSALESINSDASVRLRCGGRSTVLGAGFVDESRDGGGDTVDFYQLLTYDDPSQKQCDESIILDDSILLGLRLHTLAVSFDGVAAESSLRAPLVDNLDISTVHRCIVERGLEWVVVTTNDRHALFEGRRASITPSLSSAAEPFSTSHSSQSRSAPMISSTPSDRGGNKMLPQSNPSDPAISIELLNPTHADFCSASVMYKDQTSGALVRKDVTKNKTLCLKKALTDAMEAAMATYGIPPIINIYNECVLNTINGNHNSQVNTNNMNKNITTGNGGDDGSVSGFEILRDKLLAYASERRHRKRDGSVFEPIRSCPCAYREIASYPAYINGALKKDPVFMSNPRRFDDMLKFLVNYQLDEIPDFDRDPRLLSFDNGLLDISTLDFTPYDTMSNEDAATRVARHHVSSTYSGNSDTPLLDRVLGAQFTPEVAELLCAMLGRLLFPVGELDNWQVMPYLVGVGGTGKSLLLTIVSKLMAPGSVGNLSSKREEVFGMANLADKDVVIGRDMPAKLSASLPQELMQCMTVGEEMEVPRKGSSALQVTWRAPVVLASNHMPDYINVGNNVSRRLVVFKFEHPVAHPQEGLLNSILTQELPNIACRFLRAYHAHREGAVVASGGFWQSVPPQILEWQSSLAASTNRLYEFLTMDSESRGCNIRHVPGRVTWYLEFKAAYERTMGERLVSPDIAVLHQLGFDISPKRENVCKHCKQLARSRPERCCDAYDHSQRATKVVVHNMEMEEVVDIGE